MAAAACSGAAGVGLDTGAATRTYRALGPQLIGHLPHEHPFGRGSGSGEWAASPGEAGRGRLGVGAAVPARRGDRTEPHVSE